MPVKLRLQRRGKKGKPYFWIIAADSRAKRDGRFIEKIGHYNPTTNPADIGLNIDDAVKWLQNGAQPTKTVRAILSYKGALLKNHLAGGVRKGALTEEQAEAKFNEWVENKKEFIDSRKESLAEAKEKEKAEKLAAEKAVNDKRAAEAAATEESEAQAEAATEETEAEATTEEAVIEPTETPERETSEGEEPKA